MSTAFKCLISCIEKAANRRHRETFTTMTSESKCIVFNRIMQFIIEVTWTDEYTFMLYAVNKSREFWKDPSLVESFLFISLTNNVIVKNLRLKTPIH
jgi:hypothetical protein